MSLLFPSNNDTTLAVERGGEPVDLVTISEDWLGDETAEPRTCANGHFATGTGGMTSRPIIGRVEKPICPADIQSPDGHAAIARQDAADMASLCRGDDKAMARLMQRHASRLQMTVARMLQNRTEAAEVVEEAFIRVHQHRQRFDLQAKFTSWLYTIALNLARNRLRSRARRPEMIPLEALTEEELELQQLVFTREPAPDLHLEKLETARRLEAALAALPAQLREPLVLFAGDDCSQAEIAQRFNCSVKAIESRLYHARKQLRADLNRFPCPCALRFFASPFKPQHKIENQT